MNACLYKNIFHHVLYAFWAILAASGKEHLIQDHEAIESHMGYPEEDLTGHSVRDKPF